jgi:hypothetical protein
MKTSPHKAIRLSSRYLGLGALAAALAFVACGGDDDGPVRPTPGSGGSPATGTGGSPSTGTGGAATGTGGSPTGTGGNSGGGSCTSGAPLPLTVWADGVYAASGFMPTGSNITFSDNCGSREPGVVGSCGVFTLNMTAIKASDNWAGVAWQNPADTWNPQSALCIAAGATKIVFRAKVDGASSVKVQVGYGGQAADAVEVSKTISSSWELYEIDISGKAYNQTTPQGGVAIGFSFAVSGDDVDASSISLYFDDIRWTQ